MIIRSQYKNIDISKMNYFSGQGGFKKIDINSKLWQEKSRI